MAKRELIIDSFAGGGGASLGIRWATGREPDVAINHDEAAIAMHAANHPNTKHFTEDVWKVAPRQVTKGRPVGLLWASPDCKHFSRAKGGKPVNKSIRSLAWVVVKWAAEAKPRVIILENVREFEDWGPLLPRWDCPACDWRGTEGQTTLARRGKKRACPRCESTKLRPTEFLLPNPEKKGLTFKRFVGRLKSLGYAVAWKVLNAADYGAPTHRRRLFLIARNDGAPIVWPEPTHADPKKLADLGGGLFPVEFKPWRTAAECIDWSIPCPSIFDRKKPLAEKTLKRIALGIKRYVLDNPKPFIVDMTRENRGRRVDEPVGTVTTQGNKFNLVTPVIAPVTHAGERRCHEPGEPLPTVTGANRGELSVVAPVVARIGQTNGNGSYTNAPTVPLTTITSKAEHLLVSPVIVPARTHGGGGNGPSSVEDPLRTVTCTKRGEFAVVAPTLVNLAHGESGRWGDGTCNIEAPVGTIHAGGKAFGMVAATLVQSGYGERAGQSPRALNLEAPMGTAVGGCKQALVAAFLAKHYGGMVGVPADTPLPTTTARGTQNQLAVANLVHLNHGEKTCSGADEPNRTITASGTHAALVYSFLTKYFGTAVGTALDDSLPTATGKDRFGLVTVEVNGETFVIVDIGMRMLKPRELARGQGFDDGYVLTGTATHQVERIGNSVCPVMAKVLVEANYADGSKVASRRQPNMATERR